MKREDGRTSFSITISYARENGDYAAGIVDRLRQLGPGLSANTWYDHDIPAGDTWEQQVRERISNADVVIMLISHSYLASEFVNEQELDMIEAAESRGARVWPVLIGECSWEFHDRIAKRQFFSQAELVRAPTTKTFGRQVEKLIGEIASFLKGLMTESATGGAASAASPSPAPDLSVGLARKGSQLQTQVYVNFQEGELSRAVAAALPGDVAPEGISWRSPLASEGFAEYKDEAFLDAVGLSEFSDSLRSFWPKSGPRWDALAAVAGTSRPGVILAEGKSYPQEMDSQCKAKSPSWERIAESIGWMQSRVGITVDPERSMRHHYQLANRLAHLYWLRETVGVDAWLVLLLFSDDAEHRPVSVAEWTRAMDDLYKQESIGHLVGESVIPVILPAFTSAEIQELRRV